jgi:hypothetical protein
MNIPFEESIASRKKLFCETHAWENILCKLFFSWEFFLGKPMQRNKAPYFRRDVKRKRRRGGRGQEEGYSRQQR